MIGANLTMTNDNFGARKLCKYFTRVLGDVSTASMDRPLDTEPDPVDRSVRVEADLDIVQIRGDNALWWPMPVTATILAQLTVVSRKCRLPRSKVLKY